MSMYMVRVWISDVVVEANTVAEAEEKATEMVDEELSCATVEMAEVQSVFDGDRFRPLGKEEPKCHANL